MRWYCVHPGLPLQAELRVRAAPDSGAAERARVSQGRAIAACSPVFQVSGDAADDAPISWLQVAYQDAASGETEGGFMMASLPDGTPLLAPWETTDFCGCCEVTDPAALLFDESEETAQSLGPVQSVNLLYCMMEVRGGRVRIFHPTLQRAWIDAKDVHVVCSRLKHDFCSTAHTFYELNETLPEEAQIAIREFPSKEAQAVGLLSRGETLEVTVRGGNWLKIAGGSVDKAWIMWRTDALELLQEAPDVCSGNCERLDVKVYNSGGLQDQGTTIDNQTEPPCPHEVAGKSATGMMPTPNSEIDAAPEVDAAASAAASVAMDDEASAVAGDLPATEDAEVAQVGPSWEDRPIRPAPSLPAVAGHDDTTTASVAMDDEASAVAGDLPATEDAEVAQVGPSWEDRPIRPAPSLPAVAGHDDTTTASVAMDDEASAVAGDLPATEDAEVAQVGPSWEDRPIRPAPSLPAVAGHDDTTTASVAMDDEASAVAGDLPATEDAEVAQVGPSWEDRPIRPAPSLLPAVAGHDDTTTASVAMDDEASAVAGDLPATEDAEVAQVGPSWEDRPIRPAPSLPAVAGHDDTTTASVAMDDEASAVAGDLPATEDAEVAQVGPSWEDRPIRPAPSLPAVAGHDDTTTASVAMDDEASAVAGDLPATEDAEVAQVGPSWEDRPIRPAPSLPAVAGHDDTTTASVAMDDEASAVAGDLPATEDAEVAQVGPSWEDRPIRPAPSLPAVAGHDDTTTASVAMDDEASAVAGDLPATEDAEVAQVGPSWEDRPIRPAPSLLPAVAGHDDTTTASVAMDDEASAVAGDLPATEDAEVAQVGPSWEDRPIRPAPSLPAVAGHDDTTTASVAMDDEASAVAGDLPATEDAEVAQVGPSWEDRPIRPAPSLPAVAGHDDTTTVEVKTEHIDFGAQDGKAMEPVRKDNLAVFDGSLVEPRAGRIQQNSHYLHRTNPTNDFERRYTESETTSGSESGEIALLGGLEDVFDPVDELLPAMAEDIIREIDEGIAGVLSAAASEPVSIGAASVGGNLHDANQAAQDKTPFDYGSPSDGISYLQHFGIGKYCEHKQSLAAGSDELSQAMYEASQDDSDLVFQALVGDEPLSDDWFHEVSLRDLQAGPHLRAGPKTTYDLIMADASPEDILEAELLDDEDGDFDLIVSFKYPVPKWRAIEPSRSPSLFRRVPSAPTGMSAIETKTAISPAKPSSESDLDSDDSPSGSRQPSPASHRASISARTSPIPAKSTTPLKSVLPRQPVGPPSSPVPPAGSRLMQRKSIATPSSIRKPPSSLLRPRSFVQPSQPAAPASPALLKPAASGLTAPSRSSIPATSTSSIATPTRSLLQRRSMLSAPSPAKTIAAPSATRSSITGSIPKPTEVSSGLQAPRKSFGFRRPSGQAKKT